MSRLLTNELPRQSKQGEKRKQPSRRPTPWSPDLNSRCPEKHPPGEDPPTKFLRACRGPICRFDEFGWFAFRDFSKCSPRAKRWALITVGARWWSRGLESTDTSPESLGINVVSIDLIPIYKIGRYTSPSLQECPPRCDASSLILRSYCGLFDDFR